MAPVLVVVLVVVVVVVVVLAVRANYLDNLILHLLSITDKGYPAQPGNPQPSVRLIGYRLP